MVIRVSTVHTSTSLSIDLDSSPLTSPTPVWPSDVPVSRVSLLRDLWTLTVGWGKQKRVGVNPRKYSRLREKVSALTLSSLSKYVVMRVPNKFKNFPLEPSRYEKGFTLRESKKDDQVWKQRTYKQPGKKRLSTILYVKTLEEGLFRRKE